MSLPWIPGAVMDLLLADVGFTNTVGAGRVGTRMPADMTLPFAKIQVSGGFSLSGDGVAWSPLVQVDGYRAPAVGVEPETVAWAIAVEAARVLGRARNVIYQTMSYSARLIDGPIPSVDVSRGTDAPLYRATVRAELRVHTT